MSDEHEKVTERRKPDRVGSIPQWITNILLTLMGVMISMIWSSLDSRVKQTESKLDIILSANALQSERISNLEQHKTFIDISMNKLDNNQQTMNTLLQNLNTKIEVLNIQVQKLNK